MTARSSSTRLKLLGSGTALPGESVDNDALLAALRKHCGPAKTALARKVANRLGIRARHVSRDLTPARSGAREGKDQ